MKALLLRELRRQGNYAIIPCLALAASPILLSFVDEAVRRDSSPLLLKPELWLVFLAGILGVAAVAPDRGSGGQAFLRRVPLSLRRAFVLRVGAGAIWLALGLVLAVGGLVLSAGPLDLNPTLILGWPLAYASGLVASTVTRRPLAAIGLALPIYGLAAMAFFGPLLATGLRPPDGTVMVVLGCVPMGVTVLAAFLAYRYGRIHLEGARPFAISMVALVGFSLFGSGGTALARAAHRSLVFDTLTPVVAAGHESLALVTLIGTRWYGREQRLLILRPGQPPLPLPRETIRSPQLSPDGRQVLVRGGSLSRSGAVYDIESGQLLELDLGHSDARDILWRGDGPALVSLATSLAMRIEAATEVGKPRRQLSIALGGGVRVLSADDAGRVYLLGSKGLQRISGFGEVELPEVRPGARVFPAQLSGLALKVEQLEVPSALRERVRGLRVSRGGKLALILINRRELHLLETETGKVVSLPPPPLDDPRAEGPDPEGAEGVPLETRLPVRSLEVLADPRGVLGSFRLAFHPKERGVVVESASGWTVWCDLERGLVQTSQESDSGPGLPSFASDGDAVLLPSGRMWEAGQASPVGLPPGARSPLTWLDARHLVTMGETSKDDSARGITIFDLESGLGTQPFGGAQ